MYLEKEPSYQSPEGIHRGEFRSADVLRELRYGDITECVKMLSALISVEHPTKEFMARMIYWPEDSRQLRRDLYEIIGDDIQNLVGRNRELDPDGLKMIIGKQFDIQIVHIPSSTHKFPFCKVVQVKAPGTLLDWPLPNRMAA
jgi:hypothetical protein